MISSSSIIIGIGGLDATKSPGSGVKTLALGSCVAVVLLDPKTRAVGMVHIALPESSINTERAKELPGYFADTGIPELLKKMATLGCDPAGKGFLVKLAGGACVMDPTNTFNIGKRNILAAKKTLWHYKMGAVAEDIGGEISRTVEIFVDTGLLRLTSPNKDPWEI